MIRLRPWVTYAGARGIVHPLARAAVLVVAASVAVGCAGGSAPKPAPPPPLATPATPPSAATPAVTSSAGAASAVPTATAVTSAQEQPTSTPEAEGTAAPATPPVVLPPDEAALGARFRGPAPLDHVRAFVADESCFLLDRIPKEAGRVQTSSIGLTDLAEGDRHLTVAETTGDSPKELADLRAFVAAFPKAQHRFAIEKFGWELNGQRSYQWRAYCLNASALFGGPAELGRVKRKDGSFDEDRYWVGLAPKALAKIQALPPEARRLVFLYDDDVLAVLPVDAVKSIKTPTIALAKLPAAK